MKLSKSHLFLIVSTIALLVVLVIQVIWILNTARIKQEIYNEKAHLVLAKTAEKISKDSIVFNNRKLFVNELEMRQIDSLLKTYMRFYNITIEYNFKARQPNTLTGANAPFISVFNSSNNSQMCMEDVPFGNKNFELKLTFPNKYQFVIAEMGIPFVFSVILIFIVLLLSWRTLSSLQKEKLISEHTTEFLNNMTHEFKTPLTSIALAGKMINKEAGDKDKVEYYSGLILEENEKLRLQVEQVLSMAALERGEVPLRKMELDLHQVITDAIKHMQLQLDNSGAKITTLLKAEKSIITGDKIHLINTLCNLLDNAIKYANNTPEILIETTYNQNILTIVFKDEGIGIDKLYHKKVFDKYFRIPTGNLHNVKGFGLGLAYVNNIIQLHNGTINIESETGKGTIFTIQFHDEQSKI